jgi:hypothetical protein
MMRELERVVPETLLVEIRFLCVGRGQDWEQEGNGTPKSGINCGRKEREANT